MKFALYGKRIEEEYIPQFDEFCQELVNRGSTLLCYKSFLDFLNTIGDFNKYFSEVYDENTSLLCDYLISVGGDGTFLNSLTCIKETGIPVFGINTGRLGFLASTTLEKVHNYLDYLFYGDVKLEKRDLVKVFGTNIQENEFSYALNEISVLKDDRSSLITVNAYIEDRYLTTYWADGLIIATPTGSTAYSLSCGGPIINPDCNNLILTPVSPHNLTMRPLIIPSNVKIKLKIESRSNDFILGIDSRMKKMPVSHELFVSSGDFSLNVVKLPDQCYYNTLRNKLRWGEDVRNNKE